MENIYKFAAKNGLRFISPKGRLTVEDLFRLSLEDLDNIYRALKKLEKDRAEVSLLSDEGKDENLEVSIKIVEDVYATRKADAEELSAKKTQADRRRRIAELIAEKEDEGLKSMSVEELKKLLSEE